MKKINIGSFFLFFFFVKLFRSCQVWCQIFCIFLQKSKVWKSEWINLAFYCKVTDYWITKPLVHRGDVLFAFFSCQKFKLGIKRCLQLQERSQKDPETWVVSIGRCWQGSISHITYVVIFAWCLLQWRFVNFCLASAEFGNITRVSCCTKVFFRLFICAPESVLSRCDSKATV